MYQYLFTEDDSQRFYDSSKNKLIGEIVTTNARAEVNAKLLQNHKFDVFSLCKEVITDSKLFAKAIVSAIKSHTSKILHVK